MARRNAKCNRAFDQHPGLILAEDGHKSMQKLMDNVQTLAARFKLVSLHVTANKPAMLAKAKQKILQF
ncbi:hypothetical protein D917_01872 [Trichinella nativa]|uniref:Uncharacterized protein n=1 Tax=Trichinella nativa TaxID=6335 RepID=A0A1Y3EKK2_9BILA|nr:hypothetical protein D917_01872 [Trichinella nativa]